MRLAVVPLRKTLGTMSRRISCLQVEYKTAWRGWPSVGQKTRWQFGGQLPNPGGACRLQGDPHERPKCVFGRTVE